MKNKTIKMKNIILIFLSVLSVGMFCMEPQGLFPLGQCPKLTVVNNHTKKITVRYQPLLDESSSLIPASLGSSIIPMPCITTMHTEVIIDAGKRTQLKQLLTPFVTIKIDGFKALENLSLSDAPIPLVINAENNNQIKVTQGSFERGTIYALQLSIQARSQKHYKKENSDEDCCVLQ